MVKTLGTVRMRNDHAGGSLVESERGDGVVHIKCVINERVKALTCLCGDAGMTGVIGPIYLGLDGEKIFVLIIIESEFV